MERLTKRENERVYLRGDLHKDCPKEYLYFCENLPDCKYAKTYGTKKCAANMAANRLAELEDKLEDETLVEVKPIDFPTWEEVKGLKKRVLARYKFWDITRVGESIYCLQTNVGICMECINNSIGYLQACAWVEEQRRKLIKELCNG